MVIIRIRAKGWRRRERQEERYRYGKMTNWNRRSSPASGVRRIDPKDWVPPPGVALTIGSSRGQS